MYLGKYFGLNPALIFKRRVLWVSLYINRYAHSAWKFLLNVGEYAWFFMFEARLIRKHELSRPENWETGFEKIEARFPMHGGF